MNIYYLIKQNKVFRTLIYILEITLFVLFSWINDFYADSKILEKETSINEGLVHSKTKNLKQSNLTENNPYQHKLPYPKNPEDDNSSMIKKVNKITLEKRENGLYYKSKKHIADTEKNLSKFLKTFVDRMESSILTGDLKWDGKPSDIRIPPRPNTNDINVHEDIVYSLMGPNHDRAMLLDLYTPKNVTHKLPVLIFIHGGGKKKGHHYSNRPVAMAMTKRGIAAIAVEYRLMGEALFPGAAWDIKAAVRWVRKNADKYNLDPNCIIVSGGSAGGNIAGLVGATNNDPRFEGDGDHLEISSKVNGVILYDAIISNAGSEWLLGFSNKNAKTLNPWLHKEAVPLYHLQNKDDGVPILFIKGGKDTANWINKNIKNGSADHLEHHWPHGFEVFEPSLHILSKQLGDYFISEKSIFKESMIEYRKSMFKSLKLK